MFLDLQKAFDTVNHKILIEKLKFYGVKGVPLKWFESYLHERKQHVSINQNKSPNKFLSHGVPQGSVLGPLLFLLFINDMHKAIKAGTIRHFADDTNLLIIDKSMKKINQKVNYNMKLIKNWLTSNKISLNTGKTEIIIFKP